MYAKPRAKPALRANLCAIIIILVILIISGLLLIFFLIGSRHHVISYDASLSDAEAAFLDSALDNITLSADATFSAATVLPDQLEQYTIFNADTFADADNTDSPLALIYNAYLPVTGVYSSTQSISTDQLDALTLEPDLATLDFNTTDFYLIPAANLSAKLKLLSVDDNYFLDNFKTGAKFRLILIESENPAELWSNQLTTTPFNNFTADSILSINQTGVTALARAMQTKLDEVGDGAYFAENLQDFLSSTNYTHVSNEVSFASNCSVSSGSTVLCADLRMYSALEAIGADIIELTGNHLNDWGTDSFLETLALYNESNYLTFGGGATEETAAKPLELSAKNTNITWIGINLSTSTKANGQGASGDHPGANIYDEELLRQQIAAAKTAGNFVIVDIQYYECYCYPSDHGEYEACDSPDWGYDQRGFFRSIADMGADLVVGTQAHQPMTFELYHDTPIYYGLGNLFFDQTYWPGTTRGLILTHYFYQNQLIQTKISPTVYDTTYQTKLMTTAEAETFLARLGNAR